VITWITKAAVLAIHDQQIAEHGGSPDLRDGNLLESALARPQNLFAYGNPEPDLAALAAAYAFGIAQNHAFIDGNKRTSFVVTRTFLILNGLDITANQIERLTVWIDLGAGRLSEQALADWLRKNTAKK
jgi:death-on-curing protein